MDMAEKSRIPSPLVGSEELRLFHAGIAKFDAQKFWHAHEDWEDLWNMLKKRNADPAEILLIQGLIQTAALLVNHGKRKSRGVTNQWLKLVPKLSPYDNAWGIDINSHLKNIEQYSSDVDVWDLIDLPVKLPFLQNEEE